MVSAVVTSLTTANLTNVGDKVYLASEDSSALAAFQSLIPSVQRVYVTPDTGDVTITTAVLQVCYSTWLTLLQTKSYLNLELPCLQQ